MEPMDLDPVGSDTPSDRGSTSSQTEPPWTPDAALSQLSLQLKPNNIPPSVSEAVSQHAWDDPLRRASRWLDEDSCHTFYHNIVKDLGLKTTRSREVANWRIRKRINEAAKGGPPLPIQLPTHIDEYTQTEAVQTFVQEQPSGELRSRSAYDVVMTEWMNVRSLYTSLDSKPPVTNYENREESAPTAPYCDQCGCKLRLCRCESCHGCGELLSKCFCQRCKTCTRYYSQCACTSHMKQGAREKELVPYRMQEWVDAHKSSPGVSLTPSRKKLSQQQCFAPEELCGTYIILTSAAVYDDLNRSEVVISFSPSNNALYGRYRHGENVHGLFRTNCVPPAASTRSIPCVVAVENADVKDGTWSFDVAPVDQPLHYAPSDYSSPPYHAGGIPIQEGHDCKGITFLSSNLIVLGPQFLGHRADLAPEEGQHVVFGVRVNDERDDIDALKESWNAIHESYCDWYGHGLSAYGGGIYDVDDDDEDAGHWRGPEDEAGGEFIGSECDEKLIDELVNQLYRQNDA